jgi:hypothetical protein
MIYVYQGQQNQAAAVCSRNATLTGTIYYLWKLTHKLSDRQFLFVPFRLQPIVSYPPAYDVFCINIDDSIPQVLTGATSCGVTNVHLIPGEYELEVYQQTNNTNLNPLNSQGVIYYTLVNVIGSNANNPITYSGGQSDVFIIYNPDNE